MVTSTRCREAGGDVDVVASGRREAVTRQRQRVRSWRQRNEPECTGLSSVSAVRGPHQRGTGEGGGYPGQNRAGGVGHLCRRRSRLPCSQACPAAGEGQRRDKSARDAAIRKRMTRGAERPDCSSALALDRCDRLYIELTPRVLRLDKREGDRRKASGAESIVEPAGLAVSRRASLRAVSRCARNVSSRGSLSASARLTASSVLRQRVVEPARRLEALAKAVVGVGAARVVADVGLQVLKSLVDSGARRSRRTPAR